MGDEGPRGEREGWPLSDTDQDAHGGPFALAVELRTDCPSCGHTIPLNALEKEHRCPSCVRPLPMDHGTWEALLRGAVIQGLGMDLNEGRGHGIAVNRQPFRLLVTRTPPHCPACRTPLPPGALADLDSSGSIPCERCGSSARLRTPPSWLGDRALPGLTHLLGENAGPGEVGEGGEARGFPCPGCGAPLPFDGHDRALECPYCHARAWVPDSFVFGSDTEVVRRWFLLGPERPAPTQQVEGVPPLFCVADMAVDREGNFYLLCEDTGFGAGDCFMIWSVDPDLRQRWIRRRVLPYRGTHGRGARLTVAADGRLFVSRRDADDLTVLSAADGSDLGELRCAPRDLPDGERAGRWYELAADTDGTLLALRGDRLHRFGADGTEVDLWPGMRSSEAFLGDDHPGRVDLDDLWEHEWVRIAVGWDGATYIKNSGVVVRYGRDGRGAGVLDTATPPSYRPAVDSQGRLYELELTRGGYLRRWSPDGQEREVLREGALHGYPIHDDSRLAVAPDGTVWIQGSSRLHVVGPDGTQRFARDDEQADRHRVAFQKREEAVEEALEEEAERLAKAECSEGSGAPPWSEEDVTSDPPADEGGPRTWAIVAVILAMVLGVALLYLLAFRS